MSEGKQTQTEQEAPEQVNSSSLSQDWDDWLGQKPVKRRLTVSVKHRLILKLLRLRATRTTTGSNHVRTRDGTGVLFSEDRTLYGTTRSETHRGRSSSSNDSSGSGWGGGDSSNSTELKQ